MLGARYLDGKLNHIGQVVFAMVKRRKELIVALISAWLILVKTLLDPNHYCCCRRTKFGNSPAVTAHIIDKNALNELTP